MALATSLHIYLFIYLFYLFIYLLFNLFIYLPFFFFWGGGGAKSNWDILECDTTALVRPPLSTQTTNRQGHPS